MINHARTSWRALIFAGCFCSLLEAVPGAPHLTTPGDDAKNILTNATLSWTSVSGATSYQVQVSASTDFSSTVVDQSGIAETSLAVSSGLAASTINLGPAVNYGNQGGFYNDNPRTMIRTGSTNTYRSFEGFNDVIYEGPITNPIQNGLGNYSWSWNGITGHELYWIMAAYNPAGDTLLGQVHMEDKGQTEFPVGLALSTNFGQSWTYLGDIIHPSPITKNAGGGLFIMLDSYFYMYYNNTGGMTVARAQVDSVMIAARQKRVTPWKVYSNGGWNSSAMGEAGTKTFSGDAHGGATVVKSTGTILIFPNGSSIYASVDGLTSYESVSVGSGGPYGSFAGSAPSGTRTDHFEVGDSFYVFWDKKDWPDYNADHFYRAALTVFPEKYYWRVRASDGSGAGTWSEVRSFTTRATFQKGAVGIESTPLARAASSQGSIAIRRSGSSFIVQYSLPRSASSSPVSITIHDLRGRLLVKLTRSASVAGSSAIPDMPAMTGHCVVRLQAQEFDKSISVAFEQ